LHEKDKDLLSQIQNFFGFGGIHKHGKDSLKYRVNSLNDLQMVINHFDKYPLLTQKLKDYKLFKLAFSLLNNKDNTSIDGITKLITIKSSMNYGLNLARQPATQLKLAFPTIQEHKEIVAAASLPALRTVAQKRPDPN
jgi:hypothetical protein